MSVTNSSDTDASEDEIEEALVERRAAFYLGTASLMLVVADVEIAKSRIAHTVHAEELRIDAVAVVTEADGLWEEVRATSLRKLKGLAELAQEKGAVAYAAVGDELYCKVHNDVRWLERIESELGLRVSIVSPLQETRLGLLSAVALTGSRIAIAWQSVGDCLQCTRFRPQVASVPWSELRQQVAESRGDDLDVYSTSVSVSRAVSMMIEQVQQRSLSDSASANPCSLADCTRLHGMLRELLGPAPAWLAEAHHDVTAIGGQHGIFCVGIHATTSVNRAQLVSESLRGSVRREQLRDALAAHCGKPDEALEAAGFTEVGCLLPKLCLLLAFMDVCGIELAAFVPTVGNCAGLLIDHCRFHTD